MSPIKKLLMTAIIGAAPVLAYGDMANAATPAPSQKSNSPFILNRLQQFNLNNIRSQFCRSVPVIVNGEPTGQVRQVCS
jgi:hypothetical protein